MIKHLLLPIVFTLAFSTQAISQDIPQTKPDALSFCYGASINAEGIMVLRQEGVPIEYPMSVLERYPEGLQVLYTNVILEAYGVPIEPTQSGKIMVAKAFGIIHHRACIKEVSEVALGELL